MTTTRTDASHPFGPAFWCAYAANSALMIAVSLMFRYADFVTHLGGTEVELGWIVGIGMVGSVTMRLAQGKCVDYYGAGNIWIVAVIMTAISLLAHLGIDRLDSMAVYAWRIVYASSLAGAFGASIVFVSLRSPPERMGETIGGLGSSGFLGMALGPTLADYAFRLPGAGRAPIDRMFLWAIAATCLSLVATIAARVLAGPHRRLHRRTMPPIWWLLRRYHPGPILLIGMGMGLGINVPFYFLRPYLQTLGISEMRTFFVTYSTIAFLARIVGRRLPDRWGSRRTVLLGMSFLCLHMISFLLVTSRWTLLIPAILGGIAHAFVFPAATSAASMVFPQRHRGLATAWILTMFDAGNLVGPPIVGMLLYTASRYHWPAYATMFVVIALGLTGVTTWYGWASRPRTRLPGSDHSLSLPSRRQVTSRLTDSIVPIGKA